jgi:hypothetical protein
MHLPVLGWIIYFYSLLLKLLMEAIGAILVTMRSKVHTEASKLLKQL